MRFKILIYSLLLFCLGGHGYCQKGLEVSMHFFKDSTRSQISFPSESLKTDSARIIVAAHQRLHILYEMGYLTAYHQIFYNPNDVTEVHFFTGNIYNMAVLSSGNVSEEILNKIGFDGRAFNQRPFSHHRIVALLNRILDYAENHGYPFASINLDSINIENTKIGAWLNYQSGPLIVFDSLVVEGFEKVSSKYIMTHLGIYRGEPYEEKLIKEIPNKIALLSFVGLSGTPEVEIRQGKCTVYVELAQNKVSKVDGILGVLPNQKDGKNVLITGQVNLDLHNLFASGKRLALEWQSYDAESQLLNALYFHPNLFRTPLHIQGNFHLLKQDTTFINREFALELSLLSKSSNKIGFRTEFISSRLISTYGLEGATQLPENNDFNLNYYGLNFQTNRLNDPNLPTRGWMTSLIGSVGQKKIIRNPAVSDELYKDVDENSLQWKVLGEIDKYWKLMNNIYFRSKLSGGYLNGKTLFQSDLFRIGGLRTLRGFVENEFYTSSFGIANLELRAMFSQKTYFILFFDQGAILQDDEQNQEVDLPFGTGTGFSFSTTAGIFNFVFAMGKSNSQPFAMEYSKIHFGYISRF